jgi:hypothetical protein
MVLAGTADRVLFGLTLARAEPLTALLRFAQSRGSLVARLPRPTRTLSAFPPSSVRREGISSRLTRARAWSRATRASLPHWDAAIVLDSPVFPHTVEARAIRGQSRTRTGEIRTRTRPRREAPLQLQVYAER